MSFRGAVISVGGTATPLVTSLNRARPEFVLFVVSKESKRVVQEQVLGQLEYQPQYNFAETPDAEHLGETYKAVRREIPAWLKERGFNPDEVYVDITPGTKAMSAALAMAAAEHFSHFSYVGGAERDKGGLGVVITGAEQVISTINPWDALAIRERERATWLFRSYFAEAAADQLRHAGERCSSDLQQELKTLARLAECFASADRFQFNNVTHEYNRLRDRLNLILSHRGQYPLFVALGRLAEHWHSVEQERIGDDGQQISDTLRELLANAERRAAQGRYDDAIARLYRAAELFAHGKLYEAFQAKLGTVQRHQIPQEHLNRWVKAFGAGDGDVYKLGVRDAFRALALSRIPEHQTIAGRYESIRNHLLKRNNSILAHGLQPCDKEAFAGFWESLSAVVEVSDEQVPRWPEIEF
ncbi:MAG: TIGR02710 family CRISPR-associated CARF protein [Terriglobia bacterium]